MACVRLSFVVQSAYSQTHTHTHTNTRSVETHHTASSTNHINFNAISDRKICMEMLSIMTIDFLPGNGLSVRGMITFTKAIFLFHFRGFRPFILFVCILRVHLMDFMNFYDFLWIFQQAKLFSKQLQCWSQSEEAHFEYVAVCRWKPNETNSNRFLNSNILDEKCLSSRSLRSTVFVCVCWHRNWVTIQ